MDQSKYKCQQQCVNINQCKCFSSMFWKFAITGALNNAELKVWSCESWTCLQTLHFVPNPNSPAPELFFKARLDMTANYLIVSDINNRILYVLEVQKNDLERVATISRISEFLLPAPCMSFCIINANKNRIKYTNSEEDLYRDDVDDYDEDDTVLKMAVCINLYIVQPKKLQICNITFQTDDYLQTNVFSVINNQNDTIKSNGNKSDDDDEEDEDDDEKQCTKVQKEITNLEDLQSSVALLIQQQQQQQNQPPTQPTLNLMTPDDFNSPIINSSPNNVRNSIGNTIPSPSLLKKSIEKLSEPPVENLIDFQQPQKENVASGGSSPSREVQEILSLQNPPFHAQEYFDNIKIPEEESESIVPVQETASDKSKEVVWPDIPVLSDLKYKEEYTEESKETWNKAQLQMLNYKINAFECLLNNQTEQIRKLHGELQNQIKMEDLQNLFSKEMELSTSKNQLQITKLFESFAKEQKRREKEFHDNLITNTTEKLTKEITDSLQNIISQEIKTTILPPVLTIFENLQHQIDVHYSQKLNTIDHLLKSNISKLVGSKVRNFY